MFVFINKVELLEVIDRFMTYIVMVVSHVYTYLQTYQIVYINFVQLFECQITKFKNFFKNKVLPMFIPAKFFTDYFCSLLFL